MSTKNNSFINLKILFVIHFLADVVIAIPLFITPHTFLHFVGWEIVDPVLSRIVAAALFGIGIESWLGRNSTSEQFKGLLNLKIIWSLFAEVGILVSIFQGQFGNTSVGWLLFTLFFVFNLIWVYWKIKLSTEN